MEGHGPEPNHHISSIANDEGSGMGIAQAVSDALNAEPDEYQVGESVDEFGTVECDIVILPQSRV